MTNSSYGLPLRKIILPETVTGISDNAFQRCTGLTEVDLSRCSKLKYIGSRAFSWCRNLLSIDFSNCYELKYLGGYSWNGNPEQFLTRLIFEECSNLQNVILPPNLEVIGPQTFFEANYPTVLSRIEIPASVKGIGFLAFSSSKQLVEVKMKGTIPPYEFYGYEENKDNHPFQGVDLDKCILKVPLGSEYSYKSAKVWKDFSNIEGYNPNGEDPITHTIQVSYNDGGKVELNGNFISKDYSFTVIDQTDIQLLIKSYDIYHLKQVLVGGIDMTNKVENNLLTLPYITSSQMISISFEGNTYTTQVSYNDGGIVNVNDEFIQSGSSVSVTVPNTIKLSIFPNDGYQIKQVLVFNSDWTNQLRNNIINLTAFKDYAVTVIFEKNAPLPCTLKVSYNEGGKVEINDKSVTNNSSTLVQGSTDVRLSIIPNKGYHLKQVMVGNTNMTGDVQNDLLFLPAISEDKDIKITFDKDAPTSYSFKVTYSGNGVVNVDGDIVSNGSSIALPVPNSNIGISFLPDNEFYAKRVMLGSKDITDQIVDNSYTISTLSSDLSLYVTFEKIPTYYLDIKMEGGYSSIEINDEVIMSSTQIYGIKSGCSISFQSNKYYDIKKLLWAIKILQIKYKMDLIR